MVARCVPVEQLVRKVQGLVTYVRQGSIKTYKVRQHARNAHGELSVIFSALRASHSARNVHVELLVEEGHVFVSLAL